MLQQDQKAKFTPELKSPSVKMPFDGCSQEDYALKLVEEYKAAGIPAGNVWAQSFNLDDVLYWINNKPAFGKQAIYLDGCYSSGIDSNDLATFRPSMEDFKDMSVGYIAPPMWMLVTVEGGGFVPSAYTKSAKAVGLTYHLDTRTLRPTAKWRRLVLSVHQRDDEQQRCDA